MAERIESAPAKALRAARDRAVERSRSHRRPQDVARSRVVAAEKALAEAQAEYDSVTNQIGAALAEINELRAAYKQLTGQDMPPPDNEVY